MPPKSTPNPAARARNDQDDLLTALADKAAADDPSWAPGLDSRQKAARARTAERARPRAGRGRGKPPKL